MISLLRRAMRMSTACLLVSLFAIPTNLFAETHVVSLAELQAQLRTTSQTRQQNLVAVQQFLSSAAGRTKGLCQRTY
jgi:hypothetical protein